MRKNLTNAERIALANETFQVCTKTGETLTVEYRGGIHITSHTQGTKMEGVFSVSTFRDDNPNCNRLILRGEKLASIESELRLICCNAKRTKKGKIRRRRDGSMMLTGCYVSTFIKLYGVNFVNALRNNCVLYVRDLTDEEIQAMNIDCKYFRFEAFGDIHNETHLRNYSRIAQAYPNVNFALWTKHFGVLKRYFLNGGRLPENMNLMLSAPFINQEISPRFVDWVKQYHYRTATFTVLDGEKVKDSAGKTVAVIIDGVKKPITCGHRHCEECSDAGAGCYQFINELRNQYELLK